MRLYLALLALLLPLSSAQAQQPAGTAGYAGDGTPLLLQVLLEEAYTDDLDDLIRRGVIRVLVSTNRTSFTLGGGRPHGFEYELMQQYRAYLKTRVRPRSWPVRFVYIPLPFDELLPALIEGRGDIVAAGLTVTPARAERVAFTRPYLRDVDEVVVAARHVAGLDSLDDLAGRALYLRAGTSYADSVATLNADFAARGLKPVEIATASDRLAKEDILDFVDAGLVDLTVADRHLARLWATIYTDMVVRDDLVLRRGGQIAWAVRKTNPELLRSLNTHISRSGQGTLIGNVLVNRYFVSAEWATSPLNTRDYAQLRQVSTLLAKYGQTYGFDWRMLAAVAYRESGLDHGARSGAGAVGLMQVLPRTAATQAVGIDDIDELENNVHAGVKYLAHLRDTHFDDPDIPPADRMDFVLAAYNAGPTRIAAARRRAAQEGLDGNR